eukprot:TRINITY_DN2115_c0_g2_i12.p1 TRINITY_DN2115_c0_g2~~TRINITY_DN2115_c0_g2_i12.p1  ORF type:complete len:445 (-),score=122.59 TRINITY_DN2115_c0_g2_i12:35-1369(-)
MSSLGQQPNPCVACIIIESQTFPNVFKEKSRLEEENLSIRLIKCSLIDINFPISISVSAVFRHPMVKPDSAVTPTSISMDQGMRATYRLSRLLLSSRMQPASLKFEATVTLSNGSSITLPTLLSKPYIVMAHQSQFLDCGLQMIIQEVFREHQQIPWKLFSSELSMYFIKFIRPSPGKSIRGLSPSDLYYVRTKKFGCQEDGMISVTQFEEFWVDWFGMVVRELKYKKKLLVMWNLGLICGFLDKDILKLCMQGRENGHGILRFSESKPGAIATTAFVNSKLWNGLIKPEETKTKSHADFVRTKPEITHLLQFMNEYSTNGSFKSVPVLRPLPKFVALKDITSQQDEEEEETTEGYDEWDQRGNSSSEPTNTFNSTLVPLTNFNFTNSVQFANLPTLNMSFPTGGVGGVGGGGGGVGGGVSGVGGLSVPGWDLYGFLTKSNNGK